MVNSSVSNIQTHFRTALLGKSGLAHLLLKLVALTTILCAFFILGGWKFSPMAFALEYPWLAQVHPVIALGMLLIAFALRLGTRRTINRRARRYHLVFRLAAMAMGCLAIVAAFTQDGHLLLDAFLPTGGFGFLPSPAAGFCLFILALSLAVAETRKAINATQGMVCLAAIVSLFAVIADLYGVQPPTGSVRWGIDGPSGILLLAMGLTLLYQLAHRGPLSVIGGDTAGGAVARRLLPASIIVPVALGWLRLKAEEAGLVSPATGLFLHVFFSVVVMVAIVWRSAVQLARASAVQTSGALKLRGLESSYRELLHLLPEPVMIYDASGAVRFLNRAAQDYFSTNCLGEGIWTVETLLGKQSWCAIFAPLLLGGGEGRRRCVDLDCSRGATRYAYIDTVHLDRSNTEIEIAIVFHPLTQEPSGAIQNLAAATSRPATLPLPRELAS